MPAPNALPNLAFPWPRPRETGALLMGIVNVTPDSFSDGGYFADAEAAIAQAERLAAEGADIVDIGSESTRPAHTPISADEEIARLRPVFEGLRRRGFATPISIDTYKAATARFALQNGACIVNDVWGLQRDPEMAGVVAAARAGLVIMHNRAAKDETIDIVDDMERFFAHSLVLAREAGIADARIALDPGIGFGKTFEQNLAAIRAIPRLRALGFRVLLGVSRKSFIGLMTDRPVTERLAGTLGANLAGFALGADVLRVHDVAPHRDAIRVAQALLPTLPDKPE
jgi:dihydropteroate synthase